MPIHHRYWKAHWIKKINKDWFHERMISLCVQSIKVSCQCMISIKSDFIFQLLMKSFWRPHLGVGVDSIEHLLTKSYYARLSSTTHHEIYSLHEFFFRLSVWTQNRRQHQNYIFLVSDLTDNLLALNFAGITLLIKHIWGVTTCHEWCRGSLL